MPIRVVVGGGVQCGRRWGRRVCAGRFGWREGLAKIGAGVGCARMGRAGFLCGGEGRSGCVVWVGEGVEGGGCVGIESEVGMGGPWVWVRES